MIKNHKQLKRQLIPGLSQHSQNLDIQIIKES